MCTVRVNVRDENDAPYWSPSKDGSGYLPALSIEERSKRNTRIGGTDFATDEDVGQGLEYTISAGNEDGMFWMRQCNGQVYVNKDMASSGAELDYNTRQFYDLTVQVQDDLNFFLPNDQKTITAKLRINVIDINDSPVINASSAVGTCTIQGTTYSSCFSIAENANAGDGVTPVLDGSTTSIASDPDGDTLSYSLDTTFGDHEMFSINSNTGALSLAAGKSLDYEFIQKYTVKIIVSDEPTRGSAQKLTASATFTIKITDANDAPVIVSNSNARYSIDENSAQNVQVNFPVEATDQDAGTTITFTIQSSTPASHPFKIVQGGSDKLRCHIAVDTATLDYEDAKFASQVSGDRPDICE